MPAIPLLLTLLLLQGPPVDSTPAPRPAQAAVHMATGIKIGEVTDTQAVVWARLTGERVTEGVAWADDAEAVPEGLTLGEMEAAVSARPGEARVSWWEESQPEARRSTDWTPVDEARDCTVQFLLTEGLRPGGRYRLLVEGRREGATEVDCSTLGSFRTAPESTVPAPARFTVVTGQSWLRRDDAERGHRIYPQMAALDPDFFVHTGDVVYHDKPAPFAKSAELARHKWNRVYGLEFQRRFHEQVPSWFMTDDHDVLKNDCWPGQSYGALSWDEGLAIYREQTPTGERPYRSVRWGRDLEVWFVEGREFRSPNRLPDGPEKSIWGAEQKAWLKRTFAASDATFRVLVSSTPIVGPDRGNKNDNHANKGFQSEGDELRAFLAGQKDAFVVCGDRHWQYSSCDPTTGVWEFSCGPTTDAHAGGFSERNRSEAHRYLKVCGGFLEVALEYDGDEPRLAFRHRGVDGQVLNADRRIPTRSR